MNIIKKLEEGVDSLKRGEFCTAELIFLSVLEFEPTNKVASFLYSQVMGAEKASKEGSYGEKKLLDAFLKKSSHYLSVPEYNLNWAIHDLSDLEDFLFLNPMTVIDVGARNGSLGEIEDLKKYINYIGFDADHNECDALNLNPPFGFNKFRVLPYFIGNSSSEHDFHFYKSLGDSSKYKPSNSFVSKFNPNFGVLSTTKVLPVKLEEAMRMESIVEIDFLKLDTQGSELEILKSSKSTLGDVLLIESEVEVIEMYEGQPLIGEFLSFMDTQGFQVLYINRVFQTRHNYPGMSRGQVTFCDILFGKKDEYYCNYSAAKLAKHAILLLNYGHKDIAFDIWSRFPEVRHLIPKFLTYFEFGDFESLSDESIVLDKLLCWQMHQRKTNKLGSDSDRSWPFR